MRRLAARPTRIRHPEWVSRHPGDMAAQARAVFEIIGRALDEAGFSMADVIRTRMFLTDIARAPEVNAIHREVFGDIRPASTMVQVAALVDPSLLIEIEVDARRQSTGTRVRSGKAGRTCRGDENDRR